MRANQSVLALAAITVGGLANTALSAPVVFRDFQSDTVGQLPQPYDNDLLFPNPPANSSLRVVDAGSTPADPFGGAGNKCLVWQVQTAGGGGAYYVMAGSSGAAVTNGRFSTKIYQTHFGETGDPVTFFSLGNFSSWGTNTSNVALQFVIDGANGYALNVHGTRINLDPQHFLPVNVVRDIVIDFDTATDTFTAQVNGVQMTANGGSMTTFPFLSPSNGIYAVEVLSPTSSRTGQVFIDNVTIDAIPEPGSVIPAAAIAGCAAMRRRRG